LLVDAVTEKDYSYKKVRRIWFYKIKEVYKFNKFPFYFLSIILLRN
jgi:hypothetical protein